MDFVVPPCETCKHGPLKPAVVFFGDGVPLATAEEARAMSDGCDGVLIVGSSVSTFSAFRLVRDAHARGVPVAVLTCGWTRVDEMASVKVEKLAEVLPAGGSAQAGGAVGVLSDARHVRRSPSLASPIAAWSRDIQIASTLIR